MALSIIAVAAGLDKGLNASNTAPADLAGTNRVINKDIDLGAYEFSGSPELAKILVTANDSLRADREVTDAEGWTHYYKGCYYLMSLKKRGEKIGVIGDGKFDVKIKTLAGYGSGKPANLSSATYISPGLNWKTFNRYWKISTVGEPADSIEMRFPYSISDFTDITASDTSITNQGQLVFYKTDGAGDPMRLTATLPDFHRYSYGESPSTSRWTIAKLDSGIYTANYYVKKLNGGGGGGHLSTTCTENLSNWLGITSNWNDPDNWSGGEEPTVCTHAVVNSGVSFMPLVNGTNSACNKLTIGPGASVTVGPGAHLNIIGQ